MTHYQLWVFLHVGIVIVWVGAGTTLVLATLYAQRAADQNARGSDRLRRLAWASGLRALVAGGARLWDRGRAIGALGVATLGPALASARTRSRFCSTLPCDCRCSGGPAVAEPRRAERLGC